MEATAEPKLKYWIERIKSENLLDPSAVYGYFPCGRKGNELIVYNSNKKDILGSFTFPRQKSGNKLCIADFFADLVQGEPVDYLPMQAVTMGHYASEFAQALFAKDKYTDYLYFHGLIVQLAEALAEYNHSIIRKECGFTEVKAKVIFPGMATIWTATKPNELE